MNLDDILTATRDVADPDAATLARGREAALAAVHDDLTNRGRIMRRRTQRRATYAAAVLGTAAAVAVFVAMPGSNQAPNHIAVPAPPVVEAQFANASQIVDAAATAAGEGADELGDAPYWKVTSEYAQTGNENPDDNSTGQRTIWQGITGPSVLSDTFGGGSAVEGGRTRELPKATLSVSGHTYSWREVNAGALGPDQIHELLTEDEADLPTKEGRPPHEWYFFKQAGELLSDTPAPPAVRQAIWKELATLTGVTTTGKVTDASGREGWNLTFTLKGHGSQRFIVDPSTGAILQAEVESQGSTYRITYLEAGPAETAPTPTPETRMPGEPTGKITKKNAPTVVKPTTR
jgi:hypothetical protein